jgi:hypothetical protein
LREGGIISAELRAALEAFNSGGEYVSVNPYVRRWDETLYGSGTSDFRLIVNTRLDEFVEIIFKRGPESLKNLKQKWGPRLRDQFAAERRMPRSVRSDLRQNFVAAMRQHLTYHSIPHPPEALDRIGAWIYEDPLRCPGLRLQWETRRQFINDLNAVPDDNMFLDFAYVVAIPYVDAVTMDGQMREYCRRAARLLNQLSHGTDYSCRVFSTLEVVDFLKQSAAAG